MSDGTPENHQSDVTDDAGVVVNVDPSDVADATAAKEIPEPTIGTTTTSTSNIDDAINDSSDSSLSRGLSSILSSVIRDFDFRAEETVRSQDQLSFAIDRLTRELDQLLEDAPLPFIMQHAAKISGVRKRVSSLNSLLKSIQRRVDNVDRMLSVGLLHERTTGNAGPH
ncbi:hypothetical protein F0562_009889 [Nyssa sinensis]|uniref:Biogenesis of lysosome-related organelles complex 1 subunit 7 n=1 Tax=Nyssa sinensis TaxID=561372 RepID=A0A5J5A065_9ASTE|nr:hypothetical protein F0562_009889 [Nyssa sinensis]